MALPTPKQPKEKPEPVEIMVPDPKAPANLIPASKKENPEPGQPGSSEKKSG
jgi:hypothetical protein